MYYVIIKVNGAWEAYSDEFDTYEEAKYQLECLQEVDEMNGEHHDYKICQAEEIKRVNKEEEMAKAVSRGYAQWKAEQPKKSEYKVIWKKLGKEDLVCTVDNKTAAIYKARETQAIKAEWENVVILKDNQYVPYRVFVAEREAGNIIEEIKGVEIKEAIEVGIGKINEYEGEDKACGNYTKDLYDIINEDGESYIY